MASVTNSDGSLYPEFSCPILAQLQCTSTSRQNKFETFAEYYNLLLLGWVYVSYPATVKWNLGSFQNICKSFVTVQDTRECGFNNSTNTV